MEFLSDEKPKAEPFYFDSDTAARIINAAPNPYKVMFLVAAVCGLRIGEVTALKVSSLDFKRKLLHVTAALDYTTRKESTPKSANSAAPLHMPQLLDLHLHNWIEKHYQQNPDGYLFLNSKGRPFLSDNVVKYGIHKTMARLGIARPQGGVHVGIHCFRHGVTTELLEAGTPIHLVTRNDAPRRCEGDAESLTCTSSPEQKRPHRESCLSGSGSNWSQIPNWSQLQ